MALLYFGDLLYLIAFWSQSFNHRPSERSQCLLELQGLNRKTADVTQAGTSLFVHTDRIPLDKLEIHDAGTL